MQSRRFFSLEGWAALAVATLVLSLGNAVRAEDARRIEEVIVTAERREASVQDTSISITAFTSEFLEDFGLRNQSDLQTHIPATTIQPYDATVRGVGRNFRNLGGDPGVATYMNGVYSEDLYTATVGNGFYDVERIEILRGPQGTLYGRNAIGGAINIIYNKPTDEFEGRVRAIVGEFGTEDINGVVSGPLIEERLAARLTLAKRRRDGVIENIGFGSDLDSIDEDSVALSLRWTPTDNIEVDIRGNDSNVDRTMGGATGGGLVVLTEEGNNSRNFTDPVFGWRAIDRVQTDPTANDFFVANSPVRTFVDPSNGALVEAQHLRGGVDATSFNAGRPNQSAGLTRSPTECVFDANNIDGDDVCSDTNGLNNETFDQSGTQVSAEWQLNEEVSLKYIFGYNDLLYQRTTDDDLVSSLVLDRQFYVNHEAEYYSHEVQAFYEIGDSLSFTSGLFAYDSKIDQRGDFYSLVRESRYLNAAVDLGLPAAIGLGPMVGLHDAKQAAAAANTPSGTLTALVGRWDGDPGVGGFDVDHGINSAATDLLYDTRTTRTAYAAYTQGVWDINEQLTLTFGARWARDELDGVEELFRYRELNDGLLPNDPALSPLGLSLATYNQLRGALDANGQPTGLVDVVYHGIPISLSVFRELDRVDNEVTGRLNLDYAPTDDSLWYFSVTTGYRSGGFNLAFFSTTEEFDPEELIAYEIGYKGQWLDGTLQLNGSVYYYDYQTIHTFGQEASLIGGVSTSVLEAPGAEIFGVEGEVLWLATDRLTVGGNVSYTPSEYTEDLALGDVSDPEVPESLFDPLSQPLNINGNQLLQVPEMKWSAWGTYDIPLGSNGNVQLLTSLSWIDDVYFSAFEKETSMAPAYLRWDARATWTSPAESWIVSGFVNNVTDELGIRYIANGDEETGWRQASQTTEPRLMGLEVTYRFGAFQ